MSLAELLVALVTFGLVAAAAFTLLDEGQRAWAFGVARAETQQSARVALARLTGEIRAAGRGGRGFDAVAVAAPDTIMLQQDLDGDGVIAARGERVTWRLAGTILRRDAGGGAQPIVNGVHALALTYFDAVGAPTAAPAEVRSVEIVLVTRPDYSVPGSTVSTALTTRVGGPAQSRGRVMTLAEGEVSGFSYTWWTPALRRGVCDPMGRSMDLTPTRRAAITPLGRAIGLRIVSPLAFDLPLPVLEGRLARTLPGYFGLLRYVVELDAPLPDGFDPLGELPWFARSRSVRTLVISPAPDAPTLETPPDVIGECVRDGRVLHVFVSIGPSARALRVAGEAAASESRCPFLCMADLEPRPAARAPLTTRIREARG